MPAHAGTHSQVSVFPLRTVWGSRAPRGTRPQGHLSRRGPWPPQPPGCPRPPGRSRRRPQRQSGTPRTRGPSWVAGEEGSPWSLWPAWSSRYNHITTVTFLFIQQMLSPKMMCKWSISKVQQQIKDQKCDEQYTASMPCCQNVQIVFIFIILIMSV